MLRRYLALGGAVAVLLAMIGSFGAGWHVQGARKDRQALEVENEALRKYAESSRRAFEAAGEYARKRDALRERIRVVRVEADPIIVELDRCPLPVGAVGVLDRAADVADGSSAGDSANAAGAENHHAKP